MASSSALLPAGRDLPEENLRLTPWAKARRRIKTLGVKAIAQSGVARLAGWGLGGKGAILMFHEFTHCNRAKFGSGCHVEDFDLILNALGDSGRDVVNLSEAVRRLNDPDSQPFVVLTFDDGYRSNVELALPVMERYGVPATIYVPTEAVTRTINAWWLGLRDIVRKNDRVDFEPTGTRYSCPDYDSKVATLRHLIAWVWEDFRRADMLNQTFRDNDASLPDLAEKYFMSESQIVEADRHPLIEIAAHTTTHRALRLLSDDEVRSEIADNKQFLESRLQRPVTHFAYPYGQPSLSGRREADIVQSLGFQTAVTTDPGCLQTTHVDDLYLLPRQDCEYSEDGLANAVCSINGVFGAMSGLRSSMVGSSGSDH
ncbi:polysaccharide deacetylase family protein [Rhodobacterales bacterium]|nr:polysaccharide deacetylase family protein [Rhodobacterales bacterium]